MHAHSDLLPFGPMPPYQSPNDAPESIPLEDPAAEPGPAEIDDSWPLELNDDDLDALVPEDDHEPLPEYGDFWTEYDAA